MDEIWAVQRMMAERDSRIVILEEKLLIAEEALKKISCIDPAGYMHVRLSKEAIEKIEAVR